MRFYASFGSGYRRTKYDYDDMGESRKATRHPVFPDKIDGRGYVEIEATDRGRARYLARFYFDNQYSGLYDDTSMWEEWMERSHYPSSPNEFLRLNGTLALGRIDADGLCWFDNRTSK